MLLGEALGVLTHGDCILITEDTARFGSDLGGLLEVENYLKSQFLGGLELITEYTYNS